VFLTGYYHSFWQAGLTTDMDDAAAPLVANEFTAGAISSAGGAQNENVLFGGPQNIDFHPAVNYVDGIRNGWGLVEATHADLQVTYFAGDAASSTLLPQPSVRFTLDAGDPVVSQQLL
jgi:phosphodiesterase/alkaline phosphatase D-like protein